MQLKSQLPSQIFTTYCLSIILLVSMNSSWAENKALNPNNLRHISTEQGLSQTTVNQFYEDNQGAIWIATDAGLNRFDGLNMLTMSDLNTKFETFPVNSLQQDMQSNLWISTSEGFLHFGKEYPDGRHFHLPSSKKNKSRADMVIGTHEMNKDNTWVFSWTGAYRFQYKNQDIFLPDAMNIFESKNHNLLTFEADNKNFWLGTSKGLYYFDTNDYSVTLIEVANLPLGFGVSIVKKISKTQILMAGNKGLFIFDTSNTKDKLTELTTLSSEPISSLHFDKKRLYYSSEDKIEVFDIETQETTPLLSLSTIFPQHPNFEIKTIYVDQNHLLWIGTSNQGAYILDTQSQAFDLFSRVEAISDIVHEFKDIRSISETEMGIIRFGSPQGLINFDIELSRVISNVEVRSSKKNMKIYDLIEVLGQTWIATNNGLIELNTEKNNFHTYVPSFIDKKSSFDIRSLLSVDSKTIWLASNVGVVKFDIKNHKFEYEKHLMSESNAKSARQLEYKNGFLWVGLDNEVIKYSIDKNQANTLLKSKKRTDGQDYILLDILFHNNKLWVSFKGDGIYVLDTNNNSDKIVKHLNTSSGFSSNTLISLLHYGNDIWASSTQGIIRINEANFSHQLFNHLDGLLSNDFNEGAALATKNGILLFGGPLGLTRIDPTKLKPKIQAKPPLITDLVVSSDNRTFRNPLWKNHKVVLQNIEDAVHIKFSNLDFMKRRNWRHDYWLEGAENTEVTTINRQEIVLTNIPKGISFLNIHSKSPDGETTSERTQLRIESKDIRWYFIPMTIGNYLLFVSVIIVFLYWRNHSRKKALNLYKKLQENEKLMELALLDDRRGMWDCFFDFENLDNSDIVIYQNRQKPLKISLAKHFSLIHPHDIDNARKAWLDFSTGKEKYFFASYRSFLYQKWIWNRVYGKANEFYENSHPKRATGIWTDINKEKKIEDRLNLYSHAFQSTQDIVIILDNDLFVIVVNQAYENMTGFSGDKLVGRSMEDITFSRFTRDETNNIKNQVNLNKRWQGESSVPRRNASSIPVDVRINVISKNHVDTGYVVVMTDISQFKNVKKPILESNFYDQLTGLPNKVLAFDRLRQLLHQCKEKEQELSIIFLSIDHFSKLESQLDSNAIGDLITRVSARLLPYVQKDDVLARYDQDTFIVIIRQLGNSNKNILHTVNQILKEISKKFIISDNPISISACAGIASFPDDGENWSELITKAETALAQTKQKGENLFKYYHEDSNKKAIERINLENKLYHVIQNNELFLVFQPLLELSKLKVIELDVHLRWKMDSERIVYPSQFLPMVEEIGMLNDVSDWLLNQAFHALARWEQEELNISLNINLSLKYLLDKLTSDKIKERIFENKINPNKVFISIREDDVGNCIDDLRLVALDLKSFGINLVLDDFGRSSASIQNLQEIEFHSVKLDRALIRNIGKNEFSDRILQAIIPLINDLKIGSVAKGIETDQQLAFLIEQKCRFGQGFLFSDPVNENQIRQYLLDK